MKLTKYEWPKREASLPAKPKKQGRRSPPMTLEQKQEAERLILTRGWMPEMVAPYLGTTADTVRSHCRRNGIKRPITLHRRKHSSITDIWNHMQNGVKSAHAAKIMGLSTKQMADDYEMLCRMSVKTRRVCFRFERDVAWLELREHGAMSDGP